MSKLHLTDLVVQRLQQSGTYWDETLPAFGIRVGKNRKTWIVMRGQIRQRVRIGHYPRTSLADARKEARKLLLEEPTRKPAITFSAAYDEYKPDVIDHKKPKTQVEYTRLLKKYFIPKIGRKRLAELTYEGIMECIKGASKSEADHALAVCRAFLRWCLRPPRRYITSSPLEGVQIKATKKRKRVLTSDEMKAVWAAAEQQDYPHGTIVQLLAVTGQRRGEIASLRWPWINQKERIITLPDTVTKNKKEHSFPYGDLVACILDRIPRRNSTDLLFPSKASDTRPVSGWSKFKKELADGVPNWRLHDLRRTYRTTHAEVGTPPEIAERLINHAAAVQTDVEEIYDRWHYLPQMRTAVAAFEAHFSSLLRLQKAA
jgi:integrase